MLINYIRKNNKTFGIIIIQGTEKSYFAISGKQSNRVISQAYH